MLYCNLYSIYINKQLVCTVCSILVPYCTSILRQSPKLYMWSTTSFVCTGQVVLSEFLYLRLLNNVFARLLDLFVIMSYLELLFCHFKLNKYSCLRILCYSELQNCFFISLVKKWLVGNLLKLSIISK